NDLTLTSNAHGSILIHTGRRGCQTESPELTWPNLAHTLSGPNYTYYQKTH
ncbi:Hypothetical predicted protein, partial [Pelobates cultripes]